MSTTNQAAGELTRALNEARFWCDDAHIRVKYTDERLCQMVCDAWAVVMQDVWGTASNPTLATYEVTLTENTRHFYLPTTVGEVVEAEFVDTDGYVKWRETTRPLHSPFYHGIRFEGNLRFQVEPGIYNGEVLRFRYIPGGEIVLHKGEAAVSGATSTTLTLQLPLAGPPSLGAIDRRPNAYLGAVISLTNYNGHAPAGYVQFPVQQRIITGYNVATNVVTVAPAWDFDPATLPTTSPASTITYEVYPAEATGLWGVITKYIARQMLLNEDKKSKATNLDLLYKEAKRAAQLKAANFQILRPSNMESFTYDNPDAIYTV